ncbi:MAG: glycosyltransferase [Thermoguttaceae bacterium]|nr:glycosyltransferase [Thermoguttaceae bacterium]
MRRIAFTIGVMGNGGAERVIAALSNEWAARGDKVRIITIYGTRQDYALAPEVEICPIVCKNKIKVLRPLERIGAIRRSLVEFQPNVVVSFLADVNIHTILACRNLPFPLIVSERNDPRNIPRQKWMRKLRDRVYNRTQGLVFQTNEAAEYFTPHIKKSIPTAIIPNPITDGLPLRTPDPVNRRLITACRLNPQKNLKMMIDAVGDVLATGRECFLDIFGDGPLRAELQGYIDAKGLGERIVLRGFSRNIHDEMTKSAAFVISSDYEGISNSMLEALAIGLPTIATDCPVGGARMFIEDGVNGRLTPVGDRVALKNALIDVLDRPDEAERMTQNAINIREKLDVKKIVQMWSEFISTASAR